jgi:hypothetical protein
VAKDTSKTGFLLPVSDSLTLQLFPKLKNEGSFEYLGNAYIKRQDEDWKLASEVELKAVEIKYCPDSGFN